MSNSLVFFWSLMIIFLYKCTGVKYEKTKETSEYKVVRGGSFFERPKYSTAHTRKFYYPYQPVFNVGFRMIIED